MIVMLRPRLTRVQAAEFRSLANVDIPLGPLTCWRASTGSGKSKRTQRATTAPIGSCSRVPRWFSRLREASMCEHSEHDIIMCYHP